MAAIGAAWYFNSQVREGLAFISTGLSIVLMMVTIFIKIYGSLGFIDKTTGTVEDASLNMVTASASDHTLTLMSIFALITVPVVLGYTAWAYWVFRKRLRVEDIPGYHAYEDEPKVGTSA